MILIWRFLTPEKTRLQSGKKHRIITRYFIFKTSVGEKILLVIVLGDIKTISFFFGKLK